MTKLLMLGMTLAGLAAAQTQTFYPLQGSCVNYMTTCNLHGSDGNGNYWNAAWFHDQYHDTITFSAGTFNFTCSPTGLQGLPAPLGGNFTIYANCTDTATGATLTFGTLQSNLSGMEFDSIYEPLGRTHQWVHQPISGGIVITQ